MTPDRHVYLDHAAATPLRPEVAAAIAAAQVEGFANPSSQHAAGRAARRLLEDARDRIVHGLGGRLAGHRLVFTSGSSEANHLAIVGMASAVGRDGTVFFSRRDHPSAVAAVRSVVRGGWRGEELALDTDGRIDRRAAAATLAAAAGASILSVTHVCGQTGSIDGGPATPPGMLVHVDVTQSAGLLPIDAGALSVATLALAPHKFGGPRGIGGLLVRADVAIDPVLGGTQEQGLRGGTEAVALAVGFARALEVAISDREADVHRLTLLRDRFEGLVVAAAREAGVSATVLAASGPRSPHISTIAFAGVDRQALAMAADLSGVCLATGTACASGASEPAPALVAMGLDEPLVRGAVRFSFGRTTTHEEVDATAARLGPLLRRCC